MIRIIHFLFLLSATYLTSAEIKNKGWWKHAVFYQVYPRSLYDTNSDGIGDLKGITSKLDYIVDSGIDAIWISPIYPSPMVDFGYDISNFTAIDTLYGTMDDFQTLLDRAKMLGLKVILDFVPNHTSDQHPWFQRSVAGTGKYKDYYIWHQGKDNGKSPPNNWISLFSNSAWKYNDMRKMWYLHQFEYRQPDLNYTNPDVQNEMTGVIKFWLDKGIDGFRIDAAPFIFEDPKLRDEPKSNTPGATSDQYSYLDHIYTMDQTPTYALFNSWRKYLDQFADEHNGDEKILLTEAYTTLKHTVKYYNYGVQIPFNFFLITNIDSTSNATVFKKVIDSWISHMPPNTVANWVLGNHDQSRVASRLPGKGDQMIMLQMILPGVAVTYYGEEIGMVDYKNISWKDTQDPQGCNAGKDNYQSRSRDPFRTPFQWDATKNAGFSKAKHTWLPVNENYKKLNLAKEKTDKTSHYKIYKALTSLRKSSDALKNGALKTVVTNNENVLIVSRQCSTEAIILIINFSDKDQQIVNLKQQVTVYKKTKLLMKSLHSTQKAQMPVNTSKVVIPANTAILLKSTK